jgi:hypothetical protein
MRSFQGAGQRREEIGEAKARDGVPGRSTLSEQLPPAAGGMTAALASTPLPRLDLARPVEKVVGDTSPGTEISTIENGPESGHAPAAGSPTSAEKAPKKKKAGVESFTVEWAKSAAASPTAAKLRLDYKVKLKKDDDHDPALAEFRQNVMTKWEITSGPHAGAKADTSPMHDDNYSRADDVKGHKLTDQLFESNDNPGVAPLHKDDVLDYSFTAEQMIIDTSDGNRVVARRGPHTATIKGKDARTYANVPKKLE